WIPTVYRLSSYLFISLTGILFFWLLCLKSRTGPIRHDANVSQLVYARIPVLRLFAKLLGFQYCAILVYSMFTLSPTKSSTKWVCHLQRTRIHLPVLS